MWLGELLACGLAFFVNYWLIIQQAFSASWTILFLCKMAYEVKLICVISRPTDPMPSGVIMEQNDLPPLDPEKGTWDETAMGRRHFLETSFWTVTGIATLSVAAA